MVHKPCDCPNRVEVTGFSDEKPVYIHSCNCNTPERTYWIPELDNMGRCPHGMNGGILCTRCLNDYYQWAAKQKHVELGQQLLARAGELCTPDWAFWNPAAKGGINPKLIDKYGYPTCACGFKLDYYSTPAKAWQGFMSHKYGEEWNEREKFDKIWSECFPVVVRKRRLPAIHTPKLLADIWDRLKLMARTSNVIGALMVLLGLLSAAMLIVGILGSTGVIK